MGTWTHIRTEGELGPSLSKTFQSFVSGPEIDGKECVFYQIENLINQTLTPFTVTNYSGLWQEDDFPEDPNERASLLAKQIEEDKTWNDIKEFLQLIGVLKSELNSGTFSKHKLVHKEEWWERYFGLSEEEDTLIGDLEVIETFLQNAINTGQTKTAFYVG